MLLSDTFIRTLAVLLYTYSQLVRIRGGLHNDMFLEATGLSRTLLYCIIFVHTVLLPQITWFSLIISPHKT